eukprot:s3282_g7.t1
MFLRQQAVAVEPAVEQAPGSQDVGRLQAGNSCGDPAALHASATSAVPVSPQQPFEACCCFTWLFRPLYTAPAPKAQEPQFSEPALEAVSVRFSWRRCRRCAGLSVRGSPCSWGVTWRSAAKPADNRLWGCSYLGDRVQIHGNVSPPASQEALLGTVRFVGDLEAAFAPGDWVGVELDRQVGKHNGSVKGRTYFECEPGHGLFVRPHSLTKVSVEPVKSGQSPRAAQQARSEFASEADTMRRLLGGPGGQTAVDLKKSLETLQVRLEHLETKVQHLSEHLEARMMGMLNSKVEEVAASVLATVGAGAASSKEDPPGLGPEGDTQAENSPKKDHAPMQTLREKFRLADTKYDAVIATLQQDEDEQIQYAKALELSGGEAALETYQKVSKSLERQYGLEDETKGLFSAGERRARSIKVNFQPFFATLDELFEFANKHKHHFFNLVERVAKKTRATFFNPELKAQVRCVSKAKFKYVDSAGRIEWHRLTDIDDSVEIVEFNDRYQTPLHGGYRDLQLTLRVQGGLVCELQLSTKYMLFTKETSGHRAFEIKRQLVADVAADNEKGCRDTLDWAKKDAESVLRVLNDCEKPLLHKAAAQGNSDMLQLFLEHRADVNLQAKETQRTALHEAMDQGHACAAWALISEGAREDVKDARGQTALMLGDFSAQGDPSNCRK